MAEVDAEEQELLDRFQVDAFPQLLWFDASIYAGVSLLCLAPLYLAGELRYEDALSTMRRWQRRGRRWCGLGAFRRGHRRGRDRLMSLLPFVGCLERHRVSEGAKVEGSSVRVRCGGGGDVTDS